MRPNDLIIIRRNPHHPGADGIVGTITACRPEEGHGGSDLIDVRYVNPKDGKSYTMPFGPDCLDIADEASLISLAEHHEALAERHQALAARIRGLAGSGKQRS